MGASPALSGKNDAGGRPSSSACSVPPVYHPPAVAAALSRSNDTHAAQPDSPDTLSSCERAKAHIVWNSVEAFDLLAIPDSSGSERAARRKQSDKRKRRYRRSVEIRINWLQPHVNGFKDWLTRRNYSPATRVNRDDVVLLRKEAFDALG